MFEWMAWTLPVAVFFTCIVLMLIGMTVWEIRSPTTMRKGFLPMATTRGNAARSVRSCSVGSCTPSLSGCTPTLHQKLS